MLTRSIILAALLSASAASAAEPVNARAAQLAKRVAAMENSRDLPSRAVWLGNRVARNSRNLAYVSTKPEKKGQKRPTSVKN